VATFYALALSLPFVAEWWKDYSGVYYLYDSRSSYSVNTMLIVALLALGLACVTQYAGRFQRVVFCLFILLLSLLGVVALIHVALYNAPISVGAMDAVLSTDLHEAVEYLSFHWNSALTLSVGSYLVLFVIGMWWTWPRLSHGRPCAVSHGVAWTTLLALVILAYQYPAVAARNRDDFGQKSLWARAAALNHQVPSVRILYNIGEWMEYRQWLLKAQLARTQHNSRAVLDDAEKPHTVVLVLGESLRRDRMSLYGYARPTTPNLDARRDQLLMFDHAISPSNQTVSSLTKLLTPATVEQPDRFLTEPSIITIARKAGYRTYWLSNQGRVGQFDSMISLMAHDANTTIFTNTEFYGSVYDEELLHPLEVALHEPYPNKFIVIHMLGSHQNYSSRYPAESTVFHAEDYAGDIPMAEHAAVLAEYDNSIHYTDAVLEQVLRQLEKQPNSVMLFVSDHAERFYENGVDSCGHAYPEPTRSEFDVPYFLWCKDGCPRTWRRANASHRELAFNTEGLFDTISNLLGLNMAEYSAADDILSLHYLPVAEPKIIDVNRGVHTYLSLP
jgi:heptose-I-phosphate ethanolaminephosphotransferase